MFAEKVRTFPMCPRSYRLRGPTSQLSTATDPPARQAGPAPRMAGSVTHPGAAPSRTRAAALRHLAMARASLKLWTEARTDAKLRSLTDPQHRVWFDLLCYAAEQPLRGTIQRKTLFQVAVEVARGDTSLLACTLTALVSLQSLSVESHAETPADSGPIFDSLHLVTTRYSVTWAPETVLTITFLAFEKRQKRYRSEYRDKVRERVARHRAKKELRNGASAPDLPNNGAESGGEKLDPADTRYISLQLVTALHKEKEKGSPLGFPLLPPKNPPISPSESPLPRERETVYIAREDSAVGRSKHDLDQVNLAIEILIQDLRTEALGVELGRSHSISGLVQIAGWRWLKAADKILGPGFTDSQRRSLKYFSKVAANLAEEDRDGIPGETPAQRRYREQLAAFEAWDGSEYKPS